MNPSDYHYLDDSTQRLVENHHDLTDINIVNPPYEVLMMNAEAMPLEAARELQNRSEILHYNEDSNISQIISIVPSVQSLILPLFMWG